MTDSEPSRGNCSTQRMSLCLDDFPAIVATQILSYLDWNEKLNCTLGIPAWRPHLHASTAWPTVKYSQESEENIYFVREKRTNFLFCVKVYGKFMKHLSISFGQKIGRSGLQILHAIAEKCINVVHLSITPQEPQSEHMFHDMRWKKSCIITVCDMLTNFSNLTSFHLHSPLIDWSDPREDNIILTLYDASVAHKITTLELNSNSLIEHDGYLQLLKEFTGLKKLTVRREKINNDILMFLVNKHLEEVTLYQDEEISLVDAQQLGDQFWLDVLKIRPNFRVDLILRYILVIKDSFVPFMPLRSLVLDDLVNIVTKGVMDHLVSCYKNTLESFTYTNYFLENFESGDSRMPAALVAMVTTCEKLNTLLYGFPISSTSILLIARRRKFKKLIIPAVEVSYEFDWTVNEDWDSNFVQWLEAHWVSRRLLEQGVSDVQGYPWKLNDGGLSYEPKSIGYL